LDRRRSSEFISGEHDDALSPPDGLGGRLLMSGPVAKEVVVTRYPNVGRWFACAVLIGSIASASFAAGVSAATLHLTPHRDYAAKTAQFHLNFITHSANVIDLAGPGFGGSQYEEGSVFFYCPALSSKAQFNPGFPRITLRPVHGAYSFALSYTVRGVEAGYEGGTFQTLASVSVHLTGKVISANAIRGTVKVAGAPCTTPTYAYTARINPADTKYIAPNA
jgi:hypothetical protein